MKKLYILVILFLLSFNSFSQTWQWAKGIGGLNQDEGGVNSFDSNGNLFIVGNFGGQCYFQTDTLWNVAGAHGMYLAKLDNLGNEIWIKQLGGTSLSGVQERLFMSALDEVNNAIYLTGTFSGTLTLDGISVSSFSSDCFLAKLDLNGICQWIIKAGSPINDDLNSSIIIDGQNNIYWMGNLLAPGSLDTTLLQKGTYLAKVSSSGNVQWARDEFKNIDAFLKKHNNKLYFYGTTKNDTCNVDTALIIKNTFVDAIVGELDLNGNLHWVNVYQCSTMGYCFSLDIENSGDIYMCGFFEDTLQVSNQQLISNSSEDGFIIKLTANGSLIWANQSYATGTFESTNFTRLSTDADGNSYLVGNFNGTTQIGPYTLITTLPEEMFVARIDKNGNWIGIQNFGYASGGLVKEDTNGDIYVSGLFQNTISIGSTSLTSAGGWDVFIAKGSAITGQGGNERIANNQLTIYANPNKGSFKIKLPDEITNMQNAILLVFDQQGREVARFNLEESDESPRFDVNKTSAGLYTVQLVQGKKTYWGKMVVD